jgi:hypothetical protein
MDERQRRVIRAAVREADPAQIAIMRKLTPAQRAELALSMIRAGEQVAVYRLRLKRPELTELEALRTIRSRR